jgi:hypothetical protein
MAGSMELDAEGESHPPGNTFIWQADQYGALSYTDDEFPSNFSDQVDLLTREGQSLRKKPAKRRVSFTSKYFLLYVSHESLHLAAGVA